MLTNLTRRRLTWLAKKTWSNSIATIDSWPVQILSLRVTPHPSRWQSFATKCWWPRKHLMLISVCSRLLGVGYRNRWRQKDSICNKMEHGNRQRSLVHQQWKLGSHAGGSIERCCWWSSTRQMLQRSTSRGYYCSAWGVPRQDLRAQQWVSWMLAPSSSGRR